MNEKSPPDLPEILIPVTGLSLHRMPDKSGYALTVRLELEFDDQDSKFAQAGYFLTDYELLPFLESVDRVRPG